MSRDATLTFEYLYGKFNEDLALSDDDESYGSVERLAAQFFVQF